MRRLAILLSLLACPAGAAPPTTPADLFRTDKLYTLHLSFAPDQWEAMEPRIDREAPPPATQPVFGPGTFLAPEFLRAGDADRDRKLTRDEFRKIADAWFAAWDS